MNRSWKSLSVFSLAVVLMLSLVTALGAARSLAQEPAAQGEAAAPPEPPAALKAVPHVALDSAIGDLGEVVKGESATHSFVIRNDGSAPLEISDVRPACGCTVANYDDVIPPGGSGTITATLDTTTVRGGASKSISVFTNDPENPQLQLTLMVKVVDYLLFNPGFVRFIKGHGYGMGEVEQFFYSPDFEGLKVEKVVSPFPYLDVTVREASDKERRSEAGEGPQYIFTLKMKYDDAPVGPLNGEVEVYTNHPRQEIGRLPVSGFVRPRLAVTPPVVDFGEIELAEGNQARFLVNNFSPDLIEVTRVEQTLPGAKTSIATIEEGRRYHVELVLPTDLPKGPFSTQLKIYTTSKSQPMVVVPVSGTIL